MRSWRRGRGSRCRWTRKWGSNRPASRQADLTQQGHVLRQTAEAGGAVAGDEEVVFDADTAPTGDVEAGFESDDHADVEDVVGVLADAGEFVHFESDAVAEAV